MPLPSAQFAPLAGMEVTSIAVEGAVLTVDVRLSINLAAATMEQVIGRRRKLIADMGENMAVEVRQALSGSGFEEVGIAMLEHSIASTALSHPATHYNSDEHFKEVRDPRPVSHTIHPLRWHLNLVARAPVTLSVPLMPTTCLAPCPRPWSSRCVRGRPCSRRAPASSGCWRCSIRSTWSLTLGQLQDC